MYLKPAPLIIFILLASALALTSVKVYAVPPLPHSFYGAAKVGGREMPVGSVIAARLKGTGLEVGYTYVSADYPGRYSLAVRGDDPDTPEKEGPVDGDFIELYARGPRSNLWLKVAEARFMSGSITQLDVTAVDAEAPSISLSPPAPEVRQTLRGTYLDAFIESVEVKVNGVSVGFADIADGVWSMSVQLAVGVNTIEVIAKDYSGNARSLSASVRLVEQKPTVEGVEYPLRVATNSTLTDFTFTLELKQLSFKVEGPSGTMGFANVTIPKSFMKPPFFVYVDGALVPHTLRENATHSFIYFTYQHTVHDVKIVATWVVPEFPYAALALFTALLLLIPLRVLHRVRVGKRV